MPFGLTPREDELLPYTRHPIIIRLCDAAIGVLLFIDAGWHFVSTRPLTTVVFGRTEDGTLFGPDHSPSAEWIRSALIWWSVAILAWLIRHRTLNRARRFKEEIQG